MITDTFRPFYHFSSPTAFLNDPNGLVYFDGEYHLFYQWTPDGRQHWGHAVSSDLLHWEDLPVALTPDHLGNIWSGSAVVDEHDTSGLFGGQSGIIALYTNQSSDTPPNGPQVQSLAYSRDRGRTWTKYPGNPVVPNTGNPDFRDPKVFRHEPSSLWVMIVAAGNHAEIWTSTNLLAWTHASDFGIEQGVPGCIWECPDLFSVAIEDEVGQRRWVLSGSPILPSGYPIESTRTWYFVGHFDGTTFVSETPTDRPLWADYGRDNYASVTWNNVPDGRALWIGWMCDWDWCWKVPTEGWKGAMTVPRELSLRRSENGLILIQHPIRELDGVRRAFFTRDDFTLEADSKILIPRLGSSVDISAVIEPGQAAEIGVHVRSSRDERTIIGYDPANERLFIDRRRSGQTDFHERFAERHSAALPLRDGRLSLRILVDTCSIEVFADDGALVMTDLIFPNESSSQFALYSSGSEATVVHLDVGKIESTMRRE